MSPYLEKTSSRTSNMKQMIKENIEKSLCEPRAKKKGVSSDNHQTKLYKRKFNVRKTKTLLIKTTSKIKEHDL
jgi:hypothetical protein